MEIGLERGERQVLVWDIDSKTGQRTRWFARAATTAEVRDCLRLLFGGTFAARRPIEVSSIPSGRVIFTGRIVDFVNSGNTPQQAA